MQEADATLEIDAKNIEAHLHRGASLAALGRDWKAADAYSAILEINPGHAIARYKRMLARVGSNQWTLAAQDLCTLLAASAPELANCSEKMIVGVLRLGIRECLDTNTASDDLFLFCDNLLKLTPGDDQALAFRGLSHMIHERWEDALRDLSAAIERNNRHYYHFFLRGQVYESLGDWHRAKRDYVSAAELNPGNPDVKEKLQAAQIKITPSRDSLIELFMRRHRIQAFLLRLTLFGWRFGRTKP